VWAIVLRRAAAALLALLASAALAACGSGSSSGSGSSGGIQSGGQSGDAAPSSPQAGGSGGGGGLSGNGAGGGSASGGSGAPTGTSVGFKAYDPVGRPLRCIHRKHLRAERDRKGGIQVLPADRNPRVVFASTPGDATAAQIHGQAEGAEVIGNALLYVNEATDRTIKIVENCLDKTPY
jgi:hypothetical protein